MLEHLDTTTWKVSTVAIGVEKKHKELQSSNFAGLGVLHSPSYK